MGSLERLLELSARQEREGQGDAPWPPHYAKAPGEPPRVMPSRARKAGAIPPAPVGGPSTTGGSEADRRAAAAQSPTGRRVSTKPLIEIARAATKEEALAGFERWKARHEVVAAHLEPADILVDGMRGRFTLWYRDPRKPRARAGG